MHHIKHAIDRNPARYGTNIPEQETLNLLNNPVDFAQSMSRTLYEEFFMHLPMNESPRQSDDARDEYEYMMERTFDKEDSGRSTREVWTCYTEFVTYALGESREFGVGIGAVMEQLRVGLLAVLELWNAGMTQGDVHARNDLQKLRLKHDLPYSTGWHYSDLAKQKDETK